MTAEFDLCRVFLEAHPDDAARSIERLPVAEAAALIEAMPAGAATGALGLMTPAVAAECLGRLRPEAAAVLVASLRADRAAVLLRLVDGSARAAVLERLPSEEARVLLAMLRYPEGSAGALMDLRVVSGAAELAAGAAMAAIRRSPRHVPDCVYVVESGHRLIGIVRLRDLAFARPTEPLATLMSRSVGRVNARAGRAAVLAHPGWRQFHALPVVDEDGVLVGAISYETFRALEEEALGTRRPDAVATAFALGELYWLGLSGVLDGLASMIRRAAPGAAVSLEGNRGLQ
jgi:magnesium transporter